MTAAALAVQQVRSARPDAGVRASLPAGARAAASPDGDILELQRTAGNRAVAEMLLQRQPGDGPGRTERKKFKWLPELDPLNFGPTPKPFEGAVSSDPYDRQPEPLRLVIEESGKSSQLPPSVRKRPEAAQYKGELFWSRLDGEQRVALIGIYNRMQALGLWGYVARVIRVTSAECAVLKTFDVAGVTPSVVFAAKGGGLTGALISSGKMCWDAGMGGSLHGGQMSNREISEGDSVHVSVGRSTDSELGDDGDFDAHIDKYASPKGKRGIACEYDPKSTAAHLGREVVPGMIHRGKIGPVPVPPIGGIEFFPEDASKATIRPEMFEVERDEDKPPLGAAMTWRFGGGSKERRRKAAEMRAAEEAGAQGRP